MQKIDCPHLIMSSADKVIVVKVALSGGVLLDADWPLEAVHANDRVQRSFVPAHLPAQPLHAQSCVPGRRCPAGGTGRRLQPPDVRGAVFLSSDLEGEKQPQLAKPDQLVAAFLVCTPASCTHACLARVPWACFTLLWISSAQVAWLGAGDMLQCLDPSWPQSKDPADAPHSLEWKAGPHG